jgi:5-methylcytosine-specific restriction endonuclease McrA
MAKLDRAVLVLNASYEAINVCSAKRALRLVLLGHAKPEEQSGVEIHTSQLTIPIPSVIRLLGYVKMPRQNRSVSRKGILLRDGSCCQYCGTKLPNKDLTLDHVLPRCQGGESTWTNLVASCFKCNNKKAHRTPQQAGMVLLKQPRQLTIHSKHRLLATDEKTWQNYLF